MNISNNITAPCLLIFVMLALIVFHSVFFQSGGVVFSETDGAEDFIDSNEYENYENYKNHDNHDNHENTGQYIVYDNIKYIPDKFFILSIISHICVFVLPAVFYIKLKGAGYLKKLKLELPKPKYITLTIYMFFMLIAGTILINSFIYYMGGFGTALDGEIAAGVDSGDNPVYAVGVLISFIALPAICEEFLFRSVLAAEYEKYGALCAALMTSIAFAMSHFSLILFPSYFFASVIFYSLAKVTNCIIFPMILHAGYNFYNIYIWDKLAGVLRFEQNRFIFIFLTASGFMIFIYFVFSRLEKIYYDKAYIPEKTEKTNKIYKTAANSGKLKNPAYSTTRKNIKNIKKNGNYSNNDIDEIAPDEMNFFIKFSRSFLSPTFIAVIIIFFIYINIA